MATEETCSNVDAPNRLITRKESPILKYHGSTECTSILACTGIDSSQRRNLLGAAISRDLPNGKLVRIIEIDNVFAATNEKG